MFGRMTERYITTWFSFKIFDNIRRSMDVMIWCSSELISRWVHAWLLRSYSVNGGTQYRLWSNSGALSWAVHLGSITSSWPTVASTSVPSTNYLPAIATASRSLIVFSLESRKQCYISCEITKCCPFVKIIVGTHTVLDRVGELFTKMHFRAYSVYIW